MNSTVLIIRGIVAFLLGLILVLWPGATLAVILILFPIFVIIDGLMAIIIGAGNLKKGRFFSFIPMGILEIIIGIFVLIWPEITVTVFIFLMALWAFVLGLSEFFIAIFGEDVRSAARWIFAFGGAITVILGALVLAHPLITSLFLIWLFGVFFICYGIVIFIFGLVASSHKSKAVSAEQ